MIKVISVQRFCRVFFIQRHEILSEVNRDCALSYGENSKTLSIPGLNRSRVLNFMTDGRTDRIANTRSLGTQPISTITSDFGKLGLHVISVLQPYRCFADRPLKLSLPTAHFDALLLPVGITLLTLTLYVLDL